MCALVAAGAHTAHTKTYLVVRVFLCGGLTVGCLSLPPQIRSVNILVRKQETPRASQLATRDGSKTTRALFTRHVATGLVVE